MQTPHPLSRCAGSSWPPRSTPSTSERRGGGLSELLCPAAAGTPARHESVSKSPTLSAFDRAAGTPRGARREQAVDAVHREVRKQRLGRGFASLALAGTKRRRARVATLHWRHRTLCVSLRWLRGEAAAATAVYRTTAERAAVRRGLAVWSARAAEAGTVAAAAAVDSGRRLTRALRRWGSLARSRRFCARAESRWRGGAATLALRHWASFAARRRLAASCSRRRLAAGWGRLVLATAVAHSRGDRAASADAVGRRATLAAAAATLRHRAHWRRLARSAALHCCTLLPPLPEMAAWREIEKAGGPPRPHPFFPRALDKVGATLRPAGGQPRRCCGERGGCAPSTPAAGCCGGCVRASRAGGGNAECFVPHRDCAAPSALGGAPRLPPRAPPSLQTRRVGWLSPRGGAAGPISRFFAPSRWACASLAGVPGCRELCGGCGWPSAARSLRPPAGERQGCCSSAAPLHE